MDGDAQWMCRCAINITNVNVQTSAASQIGRAHQHTAAAAATARNDQHSTEKVVNER